MSHIRELKHCLTGFRTYPPIRSTTHNHNLPFTHIHTHKPTHTRTQRSLFSSAGRPSPQMFPLRVISRIWGMFWSAGPMTRSKAPEISVAGPKRACALPAELHRDAELLLSRVSEGTEMIVCVCVFACMGHINFHPFFFSLGMCSAAVLWDFSLEVDRPFLCPDYMLATCLSYTCFLFPNWRDSTLTPFTFPNPPIADIFCRVVL